MTEGWNESLNRLADERRCDACKAGQHGGDCMSTFKAQDWETCLCCGHFRRERELEARQ